MFFWSMKISENNIKLFLFFIVFVSALCTLVICFQLNFQIILIARGLQGFFSVTVALVKLTIDNRFSPKRDMQKVIDMTGLWFFGLALGTSLSGILSNSSSKFTDRTPIQIPFLEGYPYALPGIINFAFALFLMVFLASFYPQGPSPSKKIVDARYYA
mmetsp:Transcript_28299/g.21147  ORF Transcript_28299/g.21147 Transcript_28299/m.21147 type:complete len:158 (+) Transcript_28299:270-743(+)